MKKDKTKVALSQEYSKYSTYKKKQLLQDKIPKKSQSKALPIFIGILLIFALVSVTGIFSPSDLSPNQNHIDETPSINDTEYNYSFTSLQATIYASPTCGCCHLYSEYLEENGFTIDLIMDDNWADIKTQHNIPTELQSCHTTILNGYFIEGHIPLVAVGKLLEEQPNIDGITLPGMPAGSPGMSGQKSSLFTIQSMIDGQSVGVFGTV